LVEKTKEDPAAFGVLYKKYVKKIYRTSYPRGRIFLVPKR